MTQASAEWYYAKNGARFGPYAARELKTFADQGTLSRDDLVWKKGMAAWRPGHEIHGLFTRPQSPPPLPTSDLRSTFDNIGQGAIPVIANLVERAKKAANAAAQVTQTSLRNAQSQVTPAPAVKAPLDGKKTVGIALGCAGLMLMLMCLGIAGAIIQPSREKSRKSLGEKSIYEMDDDDKRQTERIVREMFKKK